MANLDPVEGKVKITNDTKGVDDAKSALDNFGESLKHIGEVAAGIGLERLTEKIVDLGKEAAQFALDTAASFEQTATSMGTLLGNTQLAGDLLQQLSDWEVHTPFDFATITNSAKELIASGEDAKDIKGTLSELADISMGDPARLQEMVSIWGEVNSQQKVTGLTIRRLSSESIPIYKYLGQAVEEMGLSSAKGGKMSNEALEKMISTGKITPAVFNQALEDMTQKGGIFYQETSRQAGTFNGVMSSLNSQAQRLALSFMGIDLQGNIDKNGIFAALKNSASDFLNFLQSHQAEIKDTLKKIGEDVVAIFKAFKNLFDFLATHKDVLTGIAAILSGVMVAGLVAVSVGLAAVAVGVWANVVAVWALTVAFLASPFGLVITMIGLITAAVVFAALNWDNFSATVKGVGEAIKETAIDIANYVINMVNVVINALNSLLSNQFVRTGVGLLTGIKLPSSIALLPNISGGSESSSPHLTNGFPGQINAQTLSSPINITNHITANTPFDLGGFNTKLGLQISSVR